MRPSRRTLLAAAIALGASPAVARQGPPPTAQTLMMTQGRYRIRLEVEAGFVELEDRAV